MPPHRERRAAIVRPNLRLDAVDEWVTDAQGGPHDHTTAALAVALGEASTDAFKAYARQIVANAKALAAGLLERGFDLVSGGTDNHLVLMDLRSRGDLTGKLAEEALGRARITVNKNTVPGEQRSPFVTSGVRLGTAALTTRGMREAQFTKIGGLIADILEAPDSEATAEQVTAAVRELCEAFPLYPQFRTEHALS
jgi:glycine hydroxymethyltransferase